MSPSPPLHFPPLLPLYILFLLLLLLLLLFFFVWYDHYTGWRTWHGVNGYGGGGERKGKLKGWKGEWRKGREGEMESERKGVGCMQYVLMTKDRILFFIGRNEWINVGVLYGIVCGRHDKMGHDGIVNVHSRFELSYDRSFLFLVFFSPQGKKRKRKDSYGVCHPKVSV